MKKAIKFILPFVLLLLILIFPNQSIAGASHGLTLWYTKIVPTLLPFMLISSFITKNDSLNVIVGPINNSKNWSSHIDIYTLLAIILGFLCGMPTGAKIIDDFVAAGIISQRKAFCLIVFCNNLSPMFIIGYTYTLCLNKTLPLYIVLISIYLPCFIIYIILKSRSFNNMNINASIKLPVESFDSIMYTSLISIFKIGLYIMLFSIILCIINYAFHNSYILLMSSILEVTNGLDMVSNNMFLDKKIKAALIVSLTSFGGISGIYQTKCVTNNIKLPLYKYAIAKALIALICFIMVYVYMNLFI